MSARPRAIPAAPAALLFLLGVGFVPSALSARVRCIGACDGLPADDARRQNAFLALQFQYQKFIREDHLRALSTTNLMVHSGGVRPLNNYSISAATAAGWTPARHSNVVIPGTGSFAGLPVSGYSIQPSLSIGANLARIGRSLDTYAPNDKDDSRLSPSRFDLVLHWVHARTNDFGAGDRRDLQASGAVLRRGFEVRYHLWKPENAEGRAWTMSGLSVGFGVIGTRSHTTMHDRNNFSAYLPDNSAPSGVVIWHQSNAVSIKATLTTVPLELRSGMVLVRWMEIYGGMGLAFHQGLGRFSTTGTGEFFTGSNTAGLAESYVFDVSPRADGALAVLLSGKTSVQTTKAFGRIGVEAGPERFKAGLEFVLDPHARGILFGLRLQF